MNNQSQEEKYDEWYKEKEYNEFVVYDPKITNGKEIIKKRILLLGAGTARDVRFLIKSNDVYAIDISRTAVDYLNKIGIKASKGNLDKPLFFKGNSFDLIIAKTLLRRANIAG